MKKDEMEELLEYMMPADRSLQQRMQLLAFWKSREKKQVTKAKEKQERSLVLAKSAGEEKETEEHSDDYDGYAIADIPDEHQTLFKDVLVGFEEYALLKGYIVRVHVTEIDGKLAYKFEVKSFNFSGAVDKDFKEYFDRLKQENPFDDIPIAIPIDEHKRIVAGLKLRVIFLKERLEFQAEMLTFQQDLLTEAVLRPSNLEITVGSTYKAGQVGAQGPNAHAHDITFNQIWQKNKGNLELSILGSELERLRSTLQHSANTAEHFSEVGAIATAEIEAKKGNGPKALEALSKAGRWSLDVAEKIGVGVAIAAIKTALGF